MMREGAAGSERRIGVYGGTFNPIHLGHLRAAAQVAAALNLERVVFVPSAEPPHKTDRTGSAIAPAQLRLAWVECALAPHPEFEVDPIEIERGGPSYTVDTLDALCERFADRRLVFIIGHDAFVDLGTWRAPETLLSMVDWAVMTRPPVHEGVLAEWLPDCARNVIEIDPDGLAGRHRSAGTRVQIVAIDALDISSSKIREALQRGRSVEHWLPKEVHASIVSSACYLSEQRHAGADERSPESRNIVNDCQNQQKVNEIVEAALERNAQEPIVLDVGELTSYTDTLVLLTGGSNRQVRGIADNIVQRLKKLGDPPLALEGAEEGRWVLIDANDVIVHIFDPDTREHFNLEGLWSDAARLELSLPQGDDQKAS